MLFYITHITTKLSFDEFIRLRSILAGNYIFSLEHGTKFLDETYYRKLHFRNFSPRRSVYRERCTFYNEGQT